MEKSQKHLVSWKATMLELLLHLEWSQLAHLNKCWSKHGRVNTQSTHHRETSSLRVLLQILVVAPLGNQRLNLLQSFHGHTFWKLPCRSLSWLIGSLPQSFRQSTNKRRQRPWNVLVLILLLFMLLQVIFGQLLDEEVRCSQLLEITNPLRFRKQHDSCQHCIRGFRTTSQAQATQPRHDASHLLIRLKWLVQKKPPVVNGQVHWKGGPILKLCSAPHNPTIDGALHLFMDHLQNALSMLVRPMGALLHQSQQRGGLLDLQVFQVLKFSDQRHTLLIQQLVEAGGVPKLGQVTIQGLKPLVSHEGNSCLPTAETKTIHAIAIFTCKPQNSQMIMFLFAQAVQWTANILKVFKSNIFTCFCPNIRILIGFVLHTPAAQWTAKTLPWTCPHAFWPGCAGAILRWNIDDTCSSSSTSSRLFHEGAAQRAAIVLIYNFQRKQKSLIFDVFFYKIKISRFKIWKKLSSLSYLQVDLQGFWFWKRKNLKNIAMSIMICKYMQVPIN